jgi:hypothetical protein
MKPSHRSFASLMFFAVARLLSAQTAVPPAAGADTGTPWGVVALLLAVGVLAGGLLIFLSIRDGRTSKASLQWLSVPGTVVFSQWVNYATAGEPPSSAPEVKYTYVVNGQTWQSSRVKFGGVARQKILDKYPNGNPVQVFFDPQQPSNAVLEPGGSTQVMLFAGIGTFVFCLLMALWIVKI